MTTRQRSYQLTVEWTGNTGQGTADCHAYQRTHIIRAEGKEELVCSSDSPFHGDPNRNNPEDLLLGSLSSCHMLWFLHFCAKEGVIVLEYSDKAEGKLIQTTRGAGYFTEVSLHPNVIVKNPAMITKAMELHKKAGEFCFIANSMRFPVYFRPSIIAANSQAAA